MNDLSVTVTADTDEFVESIEEATEAVEELQAALERLEATFGADVELVIENVDGAFDKAVAKQAAAFIDAHERKEQRKSGRNPQPR